MSHALLASRRCSSCTCWRAFCSKRSAKVTFFRIFSEGKSSLRRCRCCPRKTAGITHSSWRREAKSSCPHGVWLRCCIAQPCEMHGLKRRIQSLEAREGDVSPRSAQNRQRETLLSGRVDVAESWSSPCNARLTYAMQLPFGPH